MNSSFKIKIARSETLPRYLLQILRRWGEAAEWSGSWVEKTAARTVMRHQEQTGAPQCTGRQSPKGASSDPGSGLRQKHSSSCIPFGRSHFTGRLFLFSAHILY